MEISPRRGKFSLNEKFAVVETKFEEAIRDVKSSANHRSFFDQYTYVILTYTAAGSRNSSEPVVVSTRAIWLSITRIDFL